MRSSWRGGGPPRLAAALAEQPLRLRARRPRRPGLLPVSNMRPDAVRCAARGFRAFLRTMETSPNRLLSTPTIALLFGRSPLWAWRRARAGSFGKLTKIAGDLHASQGAVEHYAGRSFTPEQLVAAADVQQIEIMEKAYGSQKGRHQPA